MGMRGPWALLLPNMQWHIIRQIITTRRERTANVVVDLDRAVPSRRLESLHQQAGDDTDTDTTSLGTRTKPWCSTHRPRGVHIRQRSRGISRKRCWWAHRAKHFVMHRRHVDAWLAWHDRGNTLAPRGGAARRRGDRAPHCSLEKDSLFTGIYKHPPRSCSCSFHAN